MCGSDTERLSGSDIVHIKPVIFSTARNEKSNNLGIVYVTTKKTRIKLVGDKQFAEV